MLDKTSVEPHNKIRVAGEPAMYILKSTGKGRCSLRDYGAEKGTLPYIGWVGSGEYRLDRSCEGVLSSVYELTRLAVLPTHCLIILINPTRKMAWLVA